MLKKWRAEKQDALAIECITFPSQAPLEAIYGRALLEIARTGHEPANYMYWLIISSAVSPIHAYFMYASGVSCRIMHKLVRTIALSGVLHTSLSRSAQAAGCLQLGVAGCTGFGKE